MLCPELWSRCKKNAFPTFFSPVKFSQLNPAKNPLLSCSFLTAVRLFHEHSPKFWAWDWHLSSNNNHGSQGPRDTWDKHGGFRNGYFPLNHEAMWDRISPKKWSINPQLKRWNEHLSVWLASCFLPQHIFKIRKSHATYSAPLER